MFCFSGKSAEITLRSCSALKSLLKMSYTGVIMAYFLYILTKDTQAVTAKEVSIRPCKFRELTRLSVGGGVCVGGGGGAL